MKVRIIDEKVTVYRDMDINCPMDMNLLAGAEVELINVSGSEDGWGEVLLSNGQRCYISGDIRLYQVTRAVLLDEVQAYAEPSAASAPSCGYPRGTEVEILDEAGSDDKLWLRIRDNLGKEGFIAGESQILRKRIKGSIFDGRMNRAAFVSACLGVYGVVLVIVLIMGLLTIFLQNSPLAADSVVFLFILISVLAIGLQFTFAAKRFHDLNRSGLYSLCLLVPIINFAVLIELLFMKGTTGPNQYGEDPLCRSKAFRVAREL